MEARNSRLIPQGIVALLRASFSSGITSTSVPVLFPENKVISEIEK